MAYVRKTSSNAELSAIRSENAKRGAETRRKNGTCRGGRPRGRGIDTDPMAAVSCHSLDNRFVSRMSFILGTSKSSCVRILVLQYLALHDNVKMGDEDMARLEKSMAELSEFIEIPNKK